MSALLREVTDTQRYVNIVGSVRWLGHSGSHTLGSRLSQMDTQDLKHASLFWFKPNNSRAVHLGRSSLDSFLPVSKEVAMADEDEIKR